MECLTCRELIPQMLDGRLEPGAGAAVRDHLDRCADCRADRDLHAATWKLAGEYPDVRADLLAAVRRRSLRPRLIPLITSSAVAAALVLAAGISILRSGMAKEARSPEDIGLQVELGGFDPEDRELLSELSTGLNRELAEHFELLQGFETLTAEGASAREGIDGD